MRAKVAQWGNSLAVRIPAAAAAEANMRGGDVVEVAVVDGTLTVTPIRKFPTLDELLDRLDPSTIHEETDWGEPRGDEFR